MKSISPSSYCNLLEGINQVVGKEILIELMGNSQVEKDPFLFLYSMLLKIHNSLKTANLLIINVSEHPGFLDSICLILRTLMSDCISLEYLHFLDKKCSTVSIKEIERIREDHIFHGLEYIKTKGILDQLSEEDMEQEIDLFKKKNRFFFAENNAVIRKWKSSVKIVKDIRNQTSKNNPLQTLKEAYIFYSIYSKYEHLGEMTPELVHRGYRRELNNQIVLELFDCIIVALHYQESLINDLFHDQIVIDKYNKLVAKLFVLVKVDNSR